MSEKTSLSKPSTARELSNRGEDENFLKFKSQSARLPANFSTQDQLKNEIYLKESQQEAELIEIPAIDECYQNAEESNALSLQLNELDDLENSESSDEIEQNKKATNRSEKNLKSTRSEKEVPVSSRSVKNENKLTTRKTERDALPSSRSVKNDDSESKLKSAREQKEPALSFRKTEEVSTE